MQEKIKWHTMLTGRPPPQCWQQLAQTTCSDSLVPAMDPGEHAAQASHPQKGHDLGAGLDD
eukprot:9503944-Karenia_brevis.AAC.1